MISIIIPIYNCERYLSRCISSVIAQTYSNIEILLIDDGSTDNSPSICKSFAQQDNRIKICIGKNQGVSHSRNIGLTIAKGTYIFFLDSDDWLEPTCCETLLLGLQKNNTLISCASYFDNYENLVQTHSIHLQLYNRQPMIHFIKSYMNSPSLSLIFGTCWNKLIYRDLVKHIWFPEDIALHEDTIFMMQLYLEVPSITLINEPLYHYFHHNTSTSLTHQYHKNILELIIDYYLLKKDFLKQFYLYHGNCKCQLLNNCYNSCLTSMIDFINIDDLCYQEKVENICALLNNSLFLETLPYVTYHSATYHLIYYFIKKQKVKSLLIILTFIRLKRKVLKQ